MSWQTLGAIEPAALSESRCQAHQAVQIIAAAGETLLDHSADTSHTALTWSEALGGLEGRPIPEAHGLRLGLRFTPFELVVADATGTARSNLALAGSTREQLGRSAMAALGSLAGHDLGALTPPSYELPPHPISQGAAFEPDEAGLSELARWFGNAHTTLAALRPTLPDPSAILCWPHHFDIAVLAALERDAGGEATRTLGIGLSPGDEAIDEPYWYVSHWPGVPSATPPRLPAGEWTTEGFTGGLLRGSEVTNASEGQRARVEAFLKAAIEAKPAGL
jgi:hypothetical protein